MSGADDNISPTAAPWDEGRSRLIEQLSIEPGRLLAFIDNLPDEVWFVDVHGRVTLVNNATCRNLGCSSKEELYVALPKLVAGLEILTFDGRRRPNEDAPLLKALQGDTVTGEELVRNRQTGELRQRRFSAAPVRAAGQVVGAVACVQDVTEHARMVEALRQAHDELEVKVAQRTAELSKANEHLRMELAERQRVESEIRQSEERRQTILQTAMDGYWISDMQGRLLGVNAAYCQMSGYSEQELLAMRITDLDVSATSEELAAHIDRVKAQGQDRFESRHRRKDGSVYDVEVSVQYRPDEGGRGVIFLRDITERKQAQETLQASEKRYRELVQNANSAILRWNSDGTLTFVNEYAQSFFGYRAQEIIGKHVSILVPQQETDGRNLSTLLQDILVKPESYVNNVNENVCRDGRKVWMAWTNKPILDETGRVVEVLAVGSDITERKRAEEELRSANRKLKVSAERLRSLAMELTQVEQRERRQMADMLHDHLQQLLVAAKLNVAALIHSPLETAQRQSAEKASAALDEAISQSKSLVMELSPPVLREGGLGHALQWLGRRMRDLQGLEVQVEAGDGDGRTDENLRIVLFNAVRELLFNVVKHSKVRSAHVKMAILPDNQVQIVVTDKGAGFGLAEVESNGRAQGGFGLFAVRERLESLGGRLDIDSAAGRGTRITLTTPVHPPAPPARQARDLPQTESIPSPPAQAGKSGARIRVLLADDHAMMRQGISQLLLQDPDIEVVAEASDGEEVVGLVQEVRPDVVVMDVNMPKMNGIEATRAIRAKALGVEVVALSMYAEAHRAEEMRQAGAAAYVSKSEVAEALVAAIHACYRK